MTDFIKRSDAHRIALHYSGDVAAQKIMELPAVKQLPEQPGGEDKMIRIKQEYGETEIRTVGEVKDVVMEAACIIRALRHSIYSEVGEDAGKELDGIIGRRDFFESWDPMREDLKRKETEL